MADHSLATHPLAALTRLPGIEARLRDAQHAVDAALRTAPATAGALALALRAAIATAALDGHPYQLDEVSAGTVTDPVVQGALRISAQLPGLAARWRTAPRQALARLHVLAARGSVADDELGRPQRATSRLDQLCDIIAQPEPAVPALLRAAVVHGELLALRAFAGPNGMVARAAARLALIASGLDPHGLIAPEIGHLAREPEYVGAANAFATGTPDGVRAWLNHVAAAVELAASAVTETTTAPQS